MTRAPAAPRRLEPQHWRVLRSFVVTTLVAWWLPVGISVVLQSFLGFWTLSEALFVMRDLTLIYCLVWTGAALLILGGLFRHQLLELQAALAEARQPDLRTLRRLGWLYLALFTTYVGFGPPMALWNLSVRADNSYTVAQYFAASFGALPSVLLTVLPVFFVLNDMIGGHLASHGVRGRLVPLWLKLLVLGLVTPVVIDTVLLLYYVDRTGFITGETLLIWAVLVLLAAIGTGLAWRSLRYSLQPLESALHGDTAGLTPRSLDEIGDLTWAWRDLLDDKAQAEARAIQASRSDAIAQVAGGVAHDFNNLLTAIVGNLEIQRTALLDAGQDPGLIDDSLEAANRGADLVRRMLVLGRSDATTRARTTSREQLTNMLPILTMSAGGGVRMETWIDEALPPMAVDPVDLERALLNLVVNATHAMVDTAEPLIQLRAHRASTVPPGSTHPVDFVSIEVADNGSGMEPSVRQRIFEPFFTTRAQRGGNGLGLTQVSSLVAGVDGRLAVESEIGKGTTFRMWIPVTRSASPILRFDPREAVRGRGEKVLVLDDDRAVRRAMSSMLRCLGYQAITASDEAEAWAAMANQPLVLLSDIMLADGALGSEVSERITQEHPELRVIFVTGYDPDSLARKADVGDAIVLRKPFGQAELSAALAHTLEALG